MISLYMWPPDGWKWLRKQTPEKVILTKNQSGIFDKEKGTLRKESNSALNELAWHTRRLKFDDTPLSEALQTIGLFFGVKISLENESLSDCPLNAGFSMKSLSSVSTALETMLGAEMVETGKSEFELRGGRCE